ncbi:MAG: hypothetical protein AW07_03761 [Candidatus Accumulibacter sp. SK-11]|nr:MAG: hypothetical protein AW07_03761 [Candidatus Accumulibacter sp. SK-11]
MKDLALGRRSHGAVGTAAADTQPASRTAEIPAAGTHMILCAPPHRPSRPWSLSLQKADRVGLGDIVTWHRRGAQRIPLPEKFGRR